MSSPLSWRPDIDGLRAVAVTAVVIFHAFPHRLPGGFAGVDVFFVISGFLISSLIYAGLEKGRWSFAEFYERRIRRLFPALILVLSACLAFGLYALHENELKPLGKHTAGGAAFVANFVLWSEAGYFDTAAAEKPLLHLWSLGIEEQFYLVWPLLLWMAWRLRPRPSTLIALLAALATLSFGLDLWRIEHDRVGTFYSPFTRFWELLAGGALAGFARWVAHPKSRTAPHTAAGFAGAALLVGSFALLDPAQAFPGALALAPVLGAALLIAAGPATPTGRLLATPPMTWLGKISYPLYLWHWPLLAFARLITGSEPITPATRLTLVATAVLLAWGTARYVEYPLRYGTHGRLKASLLTVVLALLGSAGLWLFLAPSGETLALKRYQNAREICARQHPEWNQITDTPCLMEKPAGNRLAILGDSHAGVLFMGLSERLPIQEWGIAVYPVSCGAPYPRLVTGMANAGARGVREGGHHLIELAYREVTSDPGVTTVLLAHNPKCSWRDAQDLDDPTASDRQAMTAAMRRGLSALFAAGKRVILVLDNPALPFPPRECLPRPAPFRQHARCSFPRQIYDQDPAISQYRQLAFQMKREFPRLELFDLSPLFCDDTHCRLADEKGRLLYLDDNHLSLEGTRRAADALVPLLMAKTQLRRE